MSAQPYAPPATSQSQKSRERPAGEIALAPRVSVVIPAVNEVQNLPWLFSRMPDVVDEVILVDGISTDQTAKVARMLRPDLIVVEEPRRGKGAALRAGFERATGDYIVMLDADHDMAKGSRFSDGGGTKDMTLLRKAGNFALLGMANAMFRSRYTDLCYGFMAFRRSLLDRMQLDADGFDIEMQIVARASMLRARIAEVPSFESERRFGNSKLNTFRDGCRVLSTMLRERFRR
jgi:glycosyltransferase involved in cell wall biosynthesis